MGRYARGYTRIKFSSNMIIETFMKFLAQFSLFLRERQNGSLNTEHLLLKKSTKVLSIYILNIIFRKNLNCRIVERECTA